MNRSFTWVSVGLLASLTGCGNPSAPERAPTEIWFQGEFGTSFTRSRPEVVGNVAVFGSPLGQLVGRSVSTGAAVWTTPMCGPGGPQARRFVVANGALLAGCEAEAIAANAGTGQVLWRYVPPQDTTYDGLPGVVGGSTPATDGTYFYIPAWGASVSAVSAATGALRWVWRADRFASDTAANVFRSGAIGAAVSGDTVFVTVWHWTNLKGGTSEALMLALARDSGAELWRVVLSDKTSGGSVSGPPLLVGSLAVALTSFGELYAVARATGQVAWKYRSADYVFGTPAAAVVMGDTIYASMGDERLTALRAGDGAVLWSQPPLGATKDLLATEKRIYVPRDGMLNIHDRATGMLIATGRVKGDGHAFVTAAAASGTQIFIGSSEGAWSIREP